MDVAAWLWDLGLQRYASAFRDNDIDAEVLPNLTAEDLISIGVVSVGHRRRLLDAIARLGMTTPAAGEGAAEERVVVGETPNRAARLQAMAARWEQAKDGEGRVVLISGEPGIGKSRLTASLFAHIESEPHTRLRYFCSPHHQDSALCPFIAQLERAAGFTLDDTADAKLEKLRSFSPPVHRMRTTSR